MQYGKEKGIKDRVFARSLFTLWSRASYVKCLLTFATTDWNALLQISQQAAGQEVAGRDRLGVSQQEQPIRREAGDAESAHPLPAGDAQSVSVTVHTDRVKRCSSTLNVVAGGICTNPWALF